ncbi:MAG: TolC family protein, partial [Thermomonas haemolytica]
MKMHLAIAPPLLALALGALPVHAGDTAFLPPEPLAQRALAAQPEVRAAVAAAQATHADSRALAAGSYEWEAQLIPQRRSVAPDLRYREFEGQISRRIRLPGKAALDRAIGQHADIAANLRIDDATHQAARRLGHDWMGWLRARLLDADAQAQLDTMRQARQALARRVQLGDAARRELDTMDAELAQLQAEALRTAAEAEAARKALATTYPQLPLPATPPPLPDPAPLPGGVAYWRDLIIARSHEIGIVQQDALRQQQ